MRRALRCSSSQWNNHSSSSRLALGAKPFAIIRDRGEKCGLVLAMPISWKGTLAQYAGRLHREHPTKADVRIIDIVDTGHPALLRMWEKRQRGYRAMGYRIAADVDHEGTPARLV